MTLFIPDISHHQGDISIQALKNAGCPTVIARVGQGAGRRSNGQTYGTTQDRKWARNLSEARRVGLPIVPYWYIGNLISADENARLAASWVGDTSLPWMLDHEDASGSISNYHQVREAFARRGLRVVLGYIPQWYWSGVGDRVALTPGPPLMSSRYSTATGTPAQIYAVAGADNGAGWAGYGGQGVALWQFTNQAVLAGQKIDCSAYRGTTTQLAALLGVDNQEADMELTGTSLAWLEDILRRVQSMHRDGFQPFDPDIDPPPSWRIGGDLTFLDQKLTAALSPIAERLGQISAPGVATPAELAAALAADPAFLDGLTTGPTT